MRNKIAVITGAAGGIGLAVARKLKDAGYTAVNWDLRAAPDESEIINMECDVSSESSVQAAHELTREKFGPVSVLVNNAGLQRMAPIEEFEFSDWRLLMGVILDGAFLCSRAAVRDMKELKNGRIININSIHGKTASPFKAGYIAAKHGMLGLAKTIALETAPFHITVNSICPGFVDTPLLRGQVEEQARLNGISRDQVIEDVMLANAPIKKLTTTEQVADLVLFLCSPAASTITGEAYNMSGGWAMGM